MDPLSVAASIIALVEAGSATAKALTYTYKTYRNAPKEIRAVAADVDLISGMFDNLAASMKRSPESYTEGFLKKARNMTCNVGLPAFHF